MQGVVDIVVPLGRVPLRLAVFSTLKVTGLVAVVFQDEVDVAIEFDRSTDRVRKLCENVGRRVVDNGVNRVQPQAIKMIFSQPVERIVDEEITDHSAFWTIEVDAVSPRRAVPIGKELWRV